MSLFSISTIGSLQYLSPTQPDLSFSINHVCQCITLPTLHWQAVKRILLYLKHTVSHGLLMSRSLSLAFTAFSNADWAGCPDDPRFTSGFCIYLGINLISWSSRK
jgi:hypothetical protein